MQIKLHNVNKSYASGVETIHVLREMSFTIDGGKWLTITGPSGSGKTTLLRCISAIELVNDGEVVVGELQANTATEDERRRFRRDNIGYIFQDFQLFDQFDVLTNVMIPQLPDKSRDEAEAKARELLEMVGLTDRIHHMPSQISGGEKQRTAIARALMNDPKLMLCDEPTGSLDIENRDQILSILEEIHDNGVTIVLVTHDPELARYGDIRYELRDGQVFEKAIEAV